jgi:hypothetical protein
MLIEDIASYIEDNTDLVIDTDLFMGAFETKSPRKCVMVSEFAGGGSSWSGLHTQPVQVLSRDITYLLAETLAFTIHSLFDEKAGFSDLGLSNIFYCEVLNKPYPVGRDSSGAFVFSANYLLRMK